ncbi:MAG: aldo/keto reductase [Chloroflexales bacterium]|nr:aldo/keto reductase [Chloroflexales bacterium]
MVTLVDKSGKDVPFDCLQHPNLDSALNALDELENRHGPLTDKVDEFCKRVTRFEQADDVIKDARPACEASLRRLGTDYIDLFQLHVWDYPAEPAVALREVLEGLVQEGKIRAYGWSTDSVELARVFAEGEHCAAIQHDLNVVLDAPEMLALCEEQNLASVNRSPLARGALTGKYSKDTHFAENDVRRDA